MTINDPTSVREQYASEVPLEIRRAAWHGDSKGRHPQDLAAEAIAADGPTTILEGVVLLAVPLAIGHVIVRALRAGRRPELDGDGLRPGSQHVTTNAVDVRVDREGEWYVEHRFVVRHAVGGVPSSALAAPPARHDHGHGVERPRLPTQSNLVAELVGRGGLESNARHVPVHLVGDGVVPTIGRMAI